MKILKLKNSIYEMREKTEYVQTTYTVMKLACQFACAILQPSATYILLHIFFPFLAQERFLFLSHPF